MKSLKSILKMSMWPSVTCLWALCRGTTIQPRAARQPPDGFKGPNCVLQGERLPSHKRPDAFFHEEMWEIGSWTRLLCPSWGVNSTRMETLWWKTIDLHGKASDHPEGAANIELLQSMAHRDALITTQVMLLWSHSKIQSETLSKRRRARATI